MQLWPIYLHPLFDRWIFLNQYGPTFNDQRLCRRYEGLLSDMASHGSNIVHRISSDVSTEVAYYRFFKNEQVEIPPMISHIVSPLPDRVAARHVLIISDSSEISLKAQINDIVDGARIGVLSDNKTPGYHMHLSICLDAASGHGLGISDLMLWNRPKSRATRKERVEGLKTRSWAEKESYKWRLG